jgi:hypothetical protein
MLFTSPLNRDIWEDYFPSIVFSTLAASRGTADDADSLFRSVKSITDTYTSDHNIIVVNINPNPEILNTVIALLTAAHWAEKDYRTALTCNPNHTVRTFINQSRDFALSSGKTIHTTYTLVLTSEYTDEVILRLGAVLPSIYNLPTNEKLNNSFIESDFAMFKQSYIELIAPYIANKEKREREKGFENVKSYLATCQTSGLQNDIAEMQQNYDRAMSNVRECGRQLQDLLIRQASKFWDGVGSAVDEFLKYIRQADENNIKKITVSQVNDYLQFQLQTKLLYWDESIYDRYAKGVGNAVSSSSAANKALFNCIFKTKTVTVLFYTGFQIQPRRCTVQALRSQSIINQGVPGLHNPHMYYHNCWGNNLPPIISALQKADYIVAWEQIKSAMSGLNLADSTVFGEFCRDIYERGDAICLELAGTGEIISPNEFRKRYPQGYVVQEPVTIEPEAEPLVKKPRRRRSAEVAEETEE